MTARGPYRNGLATRDRILDAAVQALTVTGSAATLSGIAQTAGLTDGAVLHHFPTRDDLLVDAARRNVADSHTRRGLDRELIRIACDRTSPATQRAREELHRRFTNGELSDLTATVLGSRSG